MTVPAGVDENGNPMTWRQRKDREMAYRMVYEGLKAQGYDYETYKKRKEGVKTQLGHVERIDRGNSSSD